MNRAKKIGLGIGLLAVLATMLTTPWGLYGTYEAQGAAAVNIGISVLLGAIGYKLAQGVGAVRQRWANRTAN